MNDQAAATANSLGYASLSTVFKRRLIDALGTVICNGQQSLSTAFLLGSGAPFSVMQAWAENYQADQLTVKYFAANTQAGIDSMAAGAFPPLTASLSPPLTSHLAPGDVDFGTTSTTLTPAEQALMPDVQTAPVFGFAYVAAYNVRVLLCRLEAAAKSR